jgi:DNA-binding transcriptional MerR regulator
MSSELPDYPQFDDGKAPDALRTIGEVAKAMDIRQHVLRYWEEQFPMLKPIKRSGGRRYYRPEDIAVIATIDRLVHREGYTLRGARQAIAAKRSEPGAQVQAPRPSEAPLSPRAAQLSMFGEAESGMVTGLRAIRDELATALEKAKKR